MAHGNLKMDLETLGGESAEGAHSTELRDPRRRGAGHLPYCWRCAMKSGALRRGCSRPSRAYRKICAHCANWRALNAEDQRARGVQAFVPAHKRHKPGGALKLEEAVTSPAPRARKRRALRPAHKRGARDEMYEPPYIKPVGEEAYRVDPFKDPMRDYTYWVQHEQALKKGKP